MAADDLALLGELYVRRGRWDGRIFPTAPVSGRCARGNGGRHLLWVDPERDLVIASLWGDKVEELLPAVSAAVPIAT